MRRSRFWLLPLALLGMVAAWFALGCQGVEGPDRWKQEVDQQHLSPRPIRLAYDEQPDWYTAPAAYAGHARLIGVGGSPASSSLEEALAAAQDQALATAQRQMLRLLTEARNRLQHSEIRAAQVVLLETPGRSGLAFALADWPERRYEGDPRELPGLLPRDPPDLFAQAGRRPDERFRVAAWAVSERNGERLYAYCRVEHDAEEVQADLVAALRTKWKRHAEIDSVPAEMEREIEQAVAAAWQDHLARRR